MSADAPARARWDAAVVTGMLRIAVGAVLVRWPARIARLAGADSGDRLARAAVVGFGVRDLTLGVSALLATRPGSDVRRQIRLQAAADSVDSAIVAAATAAGRLPRGRGVAGVAIGAASAVSLAATAQRLPDAPVPPR
jgi:hypothetical protein